MYNKYNIDRILVFAAAFFAAGIFLANYNMLWILYEKKDVLLCGSNLPFFLLTYEWNIDIGTNNSAYL